MKASSRAGPRAARWPLVLGLCALLVVALLAALVGVAVRESGTAVERQLEARAQEAALASQAIVEGRIDGLERLVAAYAGRADVRRALTEVDTPSPTGSALRLPLQELAAATPGLVGVWVSDERGLIVDNSNANASVIGADLSYRDWYQGATREGGLYLSVGYVNRDPGQTPGFAVSTPVAAWPDGTGDAGVLGASVSLQAFEEELAGALPAAGRLVVTDQDGQVLASLGTDLPVLSRPNPDDDPRGAEVREREVRYEEQWLEVRAPLGRDWTLTVALPSALASTPTAQLQQTLVAAGLVVTALLLAALLLLARALLQRVRVQEELAQALEEVESRRRYTEEVLDTLDVAVAVVDEGGALTYFNRLSKIWHGMDADSDVIAADWSSRYRCTHVDGSPVGAEEWPLVRALQSGEAARGELTLHAPGQAPRRIVVHARALRDDDGRTFGAVSGSHDVTALRRQEQLTGEARDAALRAAESKSALLATVSHEIRTPLSGMLGMLELALLDDGLEPQHGTKLDVAAQSGQTLLRLLSDVLDLARADAGRLTLVERPCELHEVITTACAVMSGSAERKGICLTVDVDQCVPRRAICDGERITQVLLNLVGNAVKFTSTGSVAICATATGPQPGGRSLVSIAVTDSGPGIGEHEREDLFRPFEQCAAGRATGGAGLGLAITAQLVDLLGGTIEVQSEPGQGSTFSVTIPVTSTPPPPRGERAADVGDPQDAPVRARVLLAEDATSTSSSSSPCWSPSALPSRS